MGGDPWTGSRTTMPKFCSLQKATDTMVFNTGPGGSGRHDLAPICRLKGTATLPEPTPAPTPPLPTNQTPALCVVFFFHSELLANCRIPSGGPSTFKIHYICGSWFVYRTPMRVF